MCLLVVLISRLGRHGAELVGMLHEVSAEVEHEFRPPAVQCESQVPPGLLDGKGLAHPVVDGEELGMLISELRGDQVDDDVEHAGKLRVRAGDEAKGLFPSFRC